MFGSGWVRFSQADRIARGVISEKRARNTCRFGFTAQRKVQETLSQGKQSKSTAENETRRDSEDRLTLTQ